jgi:hypothetical protein
MSSNSETRACQRNKEKKKGGGGKEVGRRYSYSKYINYKIY